MPGSKKKPRRPLDKQILVRTSSLEMEQWFLAAEREAKWTGHEVVSLSRVVRRLLNDWAKKVGSLGPNATPAQMAAIRGRAYNEHAQRLEQHGARFTPGQIIELGEEGLAWMRNRLKLELVMEHEGLSARPRH